MTSQPEERGAIPVSESMKDLRLDMAARRLDRSSARWGSWHYRPQTFALAFELDGVDIYDVPLGRCDTAGAVLEWILQIRHKSWCGPGHLDDFISAMEGLLDIRTRVDGEDPRVTVARNNWSVEDE